MDFGSRFLILLVVLACTVQLYECLKFPGLKKKTEDEKEREKLLKAASVAYKRLFVWSQKLTREEIMECFKALDHFKDEFKYDLDIDELMEIQEPKEELCDSRDYAMKLKNLVKQTKKQYKALHEFVLGALEKQLELCNYGERFKSKLEQFKTEHPDQWKLVEDFNYYAGIHGIRQYDWKRKWIDNTPQMNDAMTEMFERHIYEGVYEDKTKMGYAAYNMAIKLREACKAFGDAVAATLLMNTFSPTIKQDEEKLEWLRYLNICDQSSRIDFSKSIHEMWNKVGFLGNERWNQYLGARELWL